MPILVVVANTKSDYILEIFWTVWIRVSCKRDSDKSESFLIDADNSV